MPTLVGPWINSGVIWPGLRAAISADTSASRLLGPMTNEDSEAGLRPAPPDPLAMPGPGDTGGLCGPRPPAGTG